MKRFTMTPQPKKSVKIPSSAIKPSALPRTSISMEDLKPARNVRDKAYRQQCNDNILKFLTENNYEGLCTLKSLANPSNKDFQNIFKFVYSFIDATPFMKFEDDIINILKMLKYPYSGEITRSHLSAVTPHTWPVLLSMVSWMVDLVNRSDEKTDKTTTVEAEFFDFVCDGYIKFMEGEEDDSVLEKEFISKVSGLHSQDIRDIENSEKEMKLLQDELENIRAKFEDLDRVEKRKMKIEEDLNSLIMHEKPLNAKKEKYMSSIETVAEEIQRYSKEIDTLIRTKNEFEEKISQQTINPEDVKGMNIEKIELFKELERLKPERDSLTKQYRDIEQKVASRLDENDHMLSEILYLRRDMAIDKNDVGQRTIDLNAITDLEQELSDKKEALVNSEINTKNIEEILNDKSLQFVDLENQYNYYNSKLQTIGAIYIEKKELSERSQQKNRNEMDKLDNELLKLKLDSDSAFLKSEKDFSEAKIKLDVLKSGIEREKDDINKSVWSFFTSVEASLKVLDLLDQDAKKMLSR